MITSSSNGQVKKVIAYLNKSKARREDGVYIVEGIRMVQEIPQNDLVQIYASESFAKKNKDFLQARCISCELVADDVYKKMTDTQSPQGILAVVRQKSYALESVMKRGKVPMLLLLEDLQDPGNLGTIFRSAEGAGCTGIIMSKGCADAYNPKVVRSTMGAIFRMPFAYTEDFPQMVQTLNAQGVQTYAAHLKGTAAYDEMDYTKPSAFLIGNEGNGLSDAAADAASSYVLIPMLGQVESMNAATSAAILTFEAARQRRM